MNLVKKGCIHMELEQRLIEAFGEKSFKFLNIDKNQTNVMVYIEKLPNRYNLDCVFDFDKSRLMWERVIDRRGYIFNMYFIMDGEVFGLSEEIDFSIDRINMDFKNIIMKQGR